MQHIDHILDKLRTETPFAFARFNDGEMGGIHEVGSRAARGDQVVSLSLQQALRSALEMEQEQYWIGVPCSICFPKFRKLADEIIRSDRPYVTHATLFVNRNYEKVKQDFPGILQNREIIWVSGADQKTQGLIDAGICSNISQHIKVPCKNAWGAYEETYPLLSEIPPGAVVALSCGPLSRVLAAQWWAQRQDITLLDIGSLFDPQTRGVRHRFHVGQLPPCEECN
jgi:hypothetical protein